MADPSIVLAAGSYVHWGIISISVTNLLILVGMVLVFVVALLLPFPKHHEPPGAHVKHEDGETLP